MKLTILSTILIFLALLSFHLMTTFSSRSIEEKSLIRLPVAQSKPAPSTDKFTSEGCPLKDDQDWVTGKAIDCKPSPDGRFIGRLVYNGLDSPTGYYELFIDKSLDGSSTRKVFSGDYHTVGWEWSGNNEIRVKWDCGTGCLASKVFGLDETVSMADYTSNHTMNEENGWSVEYFKSF